MGELEGMEREEARSVALRAFIGKRQAAASSTDLSAKGLKDLAERTVAMAKAAPEDKFCGLLDAALSRARRRARSRTIRHRSPNAASNCSIWPNAAKRRRSPFPASPIPAAAAHRAKHSSFVYATSNGFEGAESSHLLQPRHAARRREGRRDGARL